MCRCSRSASNSLLPSPHGRKSLTSELPPPALLGLCLHAAVAPHPHPCLADVAAAALHRVELLDAAEDAARPLRDVIDGDQVPGLHRRRLVPMRGQSSGEWLSNFPTVSKKHWEIIQFQKSMIFHGFSMKINRFSLKNNQIHGFP